MWNDRLDARLDARFAGPYRAEAMQGDLAEGAAASATSRHCLDVGPRDHVDYKRVLPHVDRLCQLAARYRAEAGGGDEWQRRWNDCLFSWDQWATLIRSDLDGYQSPPAGNRKDRAGAMGATGITAGNLGHDYRNFLALEAQWLRSLRPRAVPATRLIEAERPSTPHPSMPQPSIGQPSMPLAEAAVPSRLIPTAPPLSMPWMDDLGVVWPPSSVSGQGPSPDPFSWRP